jgi:LysR family transcriptional regulator, regulator for metE and metH
MHLEIRHLQLVAAIADAGTMTSAASRLHLTQSALSHQLREIESRLEVPLFLRLGKRMVVTDAGRRVLDSARRVLADLEAAEHELRLMAGGTSGVIRVCTQCNTGYHWLPGVLASFNRKYPEVTVDVMPDATDHPVAALIEGRVDLAILSRDIEDERLRIRPLFMDEMVALVPPRHALARRGWVSPAQLAREHLLLYSSAREESFVLKHVLGPAGLVPSRLSFVMLTEAMIAMAHAGLGVAVLPRWSAHPAIAARSLVPLSITRAGMRRQWSAATLASRVMPPFVDDFLDLLARKALPVRLASARRATA